MPPGKHREVPEAGFSLSWRGRLREPWREGGFQGGKGQSPRPGPGPKSSPAPNFHRFGPLSRRSKKLTKIAFFRMTPESCRNGSRSPPGASRGTFLAKKTRFWTHFEPILVPFSSSIFIPFPKRARHAKVLEIPI